MSFRAVKYCFDDLDDLEKPPYPTDEIWAAVKAHFHVESQAAILSHFYQNFDKARIASLCKDLSRLAQKGDKLSKHIFEEAGVYLAKSVAAVVRKAHAEIVERGIPVLCVGSVWLSWELLKPGFVTWLQKNTELKEISLLKSKITMAVGAAYMAADKAGLDISRDYSKNYSVFFKYDRQTAASVS